MFGITTRRLRAELAAAKAETDRMREERDEALKDVETWKTTAEGAAELYTDTSLVNARLTEDLIAARATKWRERYETEKRRADGLQRRLDDAMGLNTSQVEDGRLWQSTRTDGGRKPVTS